MANTVSYGTNTIYVLFDGSTAWDSAQNYRVRSVRVVPSNAGANEIFAMRDGSATASFLIPRTEMADDDDGRQFIDFPRTCQPYVKGNGVYQQA